MNNIVNQTIKQKKRRPSTFGKYYAYLADIDTEWKESNEFGSMLILSLVEELGEMTRAYLALHGRKPTNITAQKDETYKQELGDILVSILRFARVKDIDLNKQIMYSLTKIKRRKTQPKQ